MANIMNGKSSLLNTGVNLMDNRQVSPTTNLLGKAKPIASVAPNEDENLEAVANTQVSTEVPQGEPLVASEEPNVTMPTQEQPMIDTGVTGGVPSAPKEPEALSTTLTESDLEEDTVNDPFRDSLRIEAPLPVSTSAFDDAVTSDSYKSEEQTTWETVKENTMTSLDVSDKISRFIFKGAAGAADLATFPGWALGHYTMGGQKFPFSSLLEDRYPEANYVPEDDPDSYADDVLRMTQTGAEFISGGGVTNVGAKLATKGAYKLSAKVDMKLAAWSGFGYQGALEMGADDTTALLAAFLAPSTPEAYKAFTKYGLKAAYNTTVKPSVYVLDKVTSVLPLSGMIKNTAKSTVNDWAQLRKQELSADPEMWTQSVWHRKAREMVLKTPDKVRSLEEQKQEIDSLKRWIHQAIPESPEMKEHVDRMKALQDKINADLPEDKQMAFTLEQIYNPILKKNGEMDGMKEVMATLRLTNGAAYDKQLRQNHKAMFEYLNNHKGTLDPEETKAFTSFFDNHLEEITKYQENIFDVASKEHLLNNKGPKGYEFTDQPMSEELRPALDEIRGLMQKSYSAMLEKLPKDIELDTTPLKDNINEVFESLGVFSDPKAMPTYLRDVMKALVKNVDEAGDDAYTGLKNEASQVGIDLNKINRELRELSAAHKKAIDSFDAEDTEGLKALKETQADELLEAQGRHSDLLQRQKELDIAKRDVKQEAASELDSLPEPNLVNVGDIREGLKVVNAKMRKAFQAKDMDQYLILEKVKEGLTKSMDGLEEVDPDAYNLFRVTNSHYTRFSKVDFDESVAMKITERGDHLFKLTSDDSVNLLWDNAGTEDIQRFLRNFDGSREGLESYLANLDVPEGDVKAIDAYSKAAERGVEALKDIVYTSLAKKIHKVDMDLEVDPAARMEKIKKIVIDFQDKHKSKLDQIPGLEGIADDMTSTVHKLSKYRQAVQQLEDRKKMGILRDVVGPGKQALDIMSDRKTAEELYDFLTNKLAKVEVGEGNLMVAEAEANAIRKFITRGIVNEFTKNGNIDYEGLDRALAVGSGSRNNLSLVLGESEIIKLDSFRILGRAMAEGNTKFTEVLTNDATLRKLENFGLPLGRIGSLLQRRAIFTPSGGYIAGAVASKALDSMGNQQTSRAMQLLVERPFDALNLDMILMQEMRKLPEQKRNQLKRVMEGTTSHMRELAAWLPQQMSKHVQAHAAYLGFEMSQTEAVTMIEEVLYNDPRHPEEQKEEANQE
jgi:hypothetical protein